MAAATTTIENPFETIIQEMRGIREDIAFLKENLSSTAPKRIPFPQFCKQAGISRPTAYEWIRKKLVQSEMVGGRRYIVNDGALVMPERYQRA